MGEKIMQRFVLALVLVTLALPAVAQTVQQERMKACNTEVARNQLKGEERKAFMKQCASASGEGASAQAVPSLVRMQKCNADSAIKKLQGDERRSFLKQCLTAG
jgi:hypothetical protein